MDRRDRTAVVYICWNRGEDFELTGHDRLADSLEVSCPDCGSSSSTIDPS
jgi:DNA-directed RNA polymerase subunit RPC12/RpoP